MLIFRMFMYFYLCILPPVIYGTIFNYEPYSLIETTRLIGFFNFDSLNISNIAPNFEERNERYYILTDFTSKINIYCFSASAYGVKSSSISIQGQSLYFDGSSYIEIPVNINPNYLPKITIGAWIRSVSTEDHMNFPRYICIYLFYDVSQ
jgi:hypothetical protein